MAPTLIFLGLRDWIGKILWGELHTMSGLNLVMLDMCSTCNLKF